MSKQTNSADPVLQESLGYLLAKICKLRRVQAQKRLSQLGIHPGQEIVLFYLWQQDGRSQSDLAEMAHIQLATVTRMIGRLVKAGLVRRQPDREDRRVARVWLTEAGKTLQPAVQEIWEQVEAISFAQMSADEKERLRPMLQQIFLNLESAASSDT